MCAMFPYRFFMIREKFMHSKYIHLLKVSLALVFVSAISADVVRADGDDRYVPRKKQPVAVVPREEPRAMIIPPAPAVIQAEPVNDESCGCGNVRASLGVPVWFFNQEDSNLPGAGAAFDYWCDEIPLNFRVAVEGRHMYLGQDSAQYAREWDDKTPRVTFIRIPFAVEYMHDLTESTTGFIGAGPDIIHLANDIGETGVGMHVSARLHYAFTKHFGASLEAGYMWGSVKGQSDDIELDNAFVTPMLAYTF